MINWRQLYNESQAIQPTNVNVSTERVNHLVNIYKNDMIEQELHQYVQRLPKFVRCCQTCTPKSSTIYKWYDPYISGNKNIFDLRLSGQTVSALVYYWNKTLIKQNNERGQLCDFQQNSKAMQSIILNDKYLNLSDTLSISQLSNIDENIILRENIILTWIPRFIKQLVAKLLMYYTYRRAQRFCSFVQVHSQPMKSLRFLFQTKISPIFICFVHDSNSIRQIFWMFRHLITIFNWPLTTKIFSNSSFPTCSIFERMLATNMGFVDLSAFNLHRTDLLCYFYRCLKTCNQCGPIILLFDYSSVHKPKLSDYYFLSFLCDIIRSDLSIPDVILIPTGLHQMNLSFTQPFLFKEMIDFFVKKYNIQNEFCEIIKSEQRNHLYKLIHSIILHLAHDVNQLPLTNIEYEHVLAAIELCQISNEQPATIETMFDALQTILQTCPFITADKLKWSEINKTHVEEYYHKLENNNNMKIRLISVIRQEYFLEILIALSILSKIQHNGNVSRVYESDLFEQITFLLFTFNNQQNIHIRPCKTLAEFLQDIIQHCQSRNYLSKMVNSEECMKFHNSISSDHEWSDDDSNDPFIENDDADDEIILNDLSYEFLPTSKTNYRVNFIDYQQQFKFFANLFASHIEAIVFILKHHINKQMNYFALEHIDFKAPFLFRQTSSLIYSDILLFIRRAYAFWSKQHSSVTGEGELPILFEPSDNEIYPLSMEILILLHDVFVTLLNCCYM